ncbi:MAG: DUF4398 domain-containing protein [Polyangiales bacterium]
MRRNDLIVLFFGVAALAAVGCGSASMNQRQLADVQGAVRAAEEVGAQRIPDAALHLKLAREQIAYAEGLYKDDEPKRGSRMLDRAEVDAELALSLAKAEDVREEAREAKEQVDELRRKGL